MIGNWGVRIIFKVSSEQQYTFSDFTREVKGRWAEHKILNRKPKLEWLGPDSDSISLKIIVSAYRNLPPRTIIDNLEKAARNGISEYLFIGGQKVGSGKFVIENLSEEWEELDNNGGLLKAGLDVTFKEYN